MDFIHLNQSKLLLSLFVIFTILFEVTARRNKFDFGDDGPGLGLGRGHGHGGKKFKKKFNAKLSGFEHNLFKESSKTVHKSSYSSHQSSERIDDVCKSPVDPLNGVSFCHTNLGNKTCTARCNPGYAFGDGSTNAAISCTTKVKVWVPSASFSPCLEANYDTLKSQLNDGQLPWINRKHTKKHTKVVKTTTYTKHNYKKHRESHSSGGSRFDKGLQYGGSQLTDFNGSHGNKGSKFNKVHKGGSSSSELHSSSSFTSHHISSSSSESHSSGGSSALSQNGGNSLKTGDLLTSESSASEIESSESFTNYRFCLKRQGLFPHPQDCSKYISCENGKVYVIMCPRNLVYNSKTKHCDYRANVDCGSRRYTSIVSHADSREERLLVSESGVTYTSVSYCLKPRGQFSHPYNCAWFLNCWDGHIYVQVCPANLYFNQKTGQCDYQYNVKCGTRPILTEETTTNEVLSGSSQKIKGSSGSGQSHLSGSSSSHSESYTSGGSSSSSQSHGGSSESGSVSIYESTETFKDYKYCLSRDGRFEHPEDCAKYISCKDQQVYIVFCPRNLVYNPKTKYCDYHDNVDCGDRKYSSKIIHDDEKDERLLVSESGISYTSFSYCLKPRGQFPHPFNCRWFLNCWDGVIKVQECSADLYFNEHTSKCDFKANVKCGTRPLFTSETETNQISSSNQKIGSSSGFSTSHSNSSSSSHHESHTSGSSSSHGSSGESAVSIYETTETFKDYKYCLSRNGRFEHPEDCAKYISCKEQQVYIVFCPRNLVYNPITKYCDYHDNVDCGDRKYSSTIIHDDEKDERLLVSESGISYTSFSYCLKPRGQFPHPFNCRWFLNCWDGAIKVQECPADLYFNKHTSKCDVKAKVKCGSRPLFESHTKNEGTLSSSSQIVESSSGSNESHSSSGSSSHGETHTGSGSSSSSESHGSSSESSKNTVSIYETTETFKDYKYCLSRNGRFEHPKDCSKYISCKDQQVYIVFCPRNLVYNPKTKYCDYHGNVDCGDRQYVSTVFHDDKQDERLLVSESGISYTSYSYCLKPRGQFPHPFNCGWFLNCWDGEIKVQECPADLYFNEQTSKCDFKANVLCGTRPLFTSETNTNQISSSSSQKIEGSSGSSTSHSGSSSSSHHESHTGGSSSSHGGSSEFSESIISIYETTETFKDYKYCLSRVGRFEHPKDCSKYISCKDQQVYIVFCPRNLVYNPITKYCDYHGNVNCGERQYTSTVFHDDKKDERLLVSESGMSYSSYSYCLKPRGQFPHPFNCRWFLNCWDGEIKVQECPADLYFNEQTSKCDFKANVKCGSRPLFAIETKTNETLSSSSLKVEGSSGSSESHSSGSSSHSETHAGSSSSSSSQSHGNSSESIYETTETFKDYKYCLSRHGRFEHPEDCSKYISCKDKQVYVVFCPRNLVYNPITKYCDHHKNVDCGDRKYVSTVFHDDTRDERLLVSESGISYTSFSYCLKSRGQFPHPFNCGWFLDCWNGKIKVQECPADLYFNEHTSKCDFKANVKCGKRPWFTSEAKTNQTSSNSSHAIESSSGSSTSHSSSSSSSHSESHESGSSSSHGSSSETTETFKDYKYCLSRNGRFEHPEDCSKYISCKDQQVYIVFCPRNLVYNPKTKYCDYHDNVDCGVRKYSSKIIHDDEKDERLLVSESGISYTSFSYCLKPRGQFPHPFNCRWFLNCWDGVIKVQECSADLYFNEHTSKCDFKANVKCGTRPLFTSETETNQISSSNQKIGSSSGSSTSHSNSSSSSHHESHTSGSSSSHGSSGESAVSIYETTETFKDYKYCLSRNGRFEHPEDCAKYISCKDQQVYIVLCPRNLVYNPKTKYCDYHDNVDCGDRKYSSKIIHDDKKDERLQVSESGISYTSFSYCLKPRGQFPHPFNCRWFLNCWDGEIKVQECPVDLYFNEKTSNCDFKANVKCGSRPSFTSASHAYVEASSLGGSHSGGSSSSGSSSSTHHQTSHYNRSSSSSSSSETSSSFFSNFSHAHQSSSSSSNTFSFKNSSVSSNYETTETFRNYKFCLNRGNSYFPHPQDCSKYISCVNQQVNIVICPRNLVYNSNAKHCDYPSNVDCGHRYYSSTNLHSDTQEEHLLVSESGITYSSVSYCLKPRGQFPHPYNCGWFLICSDGRVYVQECPANLYFNERTSQCDNPSNVICGNRPILTEDKTTDETNESITIIEKITSVTNTSLLSSSGHCAAWGRYHYRTFDGIVYKFQSACKYILTKDCLENSFSILLQNSAGCQTHDGICQRSIIISMQDDEFVLKNGHNGAKLLYNSYEIRIPTAVKGLLIEKVSKYIMVTHNVLNFRLLWDEGLTVIVGYVGDPSGNRCGLCGSYDHNIGNDFEMLNSKITNEVSEFVTSWQVNDLGETCAAAEELRDACNYSNPQVADQAGKFCHKLLSSDFNQCHRLLNPKPYYEACKYDYCSCSSASPADCICDSFTEYFHECRRLNKSISINWRDDKICPVHCPSTMVYKECGSKCAQTCVNKKLDCLNDICVDGCYCLPGTVLHQGNCIPEQECPCKYMDSLYANGSTINKDCNSCVCKSGTWECTKKECPGTCTVVGNHHFSTFDGKKYTFLGECPYYLMKTKEFDVVKETKSCSGETSQNSCVNNILIEFSDHSNIKLNQEFKAVHNKIDALDLPQAVPGAYIYMVSSLYIKVEFENRVSLLWDGKNSLFIEAPVSLIGKTKGLCGNFNHKQKDDFTTPEGDCEVNVNEFGNKWKAKNTCYDLSSKETELEHPCEISPKRKEEAKIFCNKIKSDIFAACHDFVNPEPFFDDCMFDLCSCKVDIGQCLCPVLSAYAMECSRNNQTIQWRNYIDICPVKCDDEHPYQECSNPCEASCSSISFNPHCKPECVEGCNCPPGMTRNYNNTCVRISECPCIEDNKEYRPGFKEKRGNEICECQNARWNCTEEIAEESENVIVVKPLCSAEDSREYTSCKPHCPEVCGVKDDKCIDTKVCKTGCKCKEGYFLDAKSGKCYKSKSECPCYHGGKQYQHDESIHKECSTCLCDNGVWNCGKEDKQCFSICSMWGPSNFLTFDGRKYEFSGNCDYILVKGQSESGEAFSITTENVPCGSSGVTCSKSISVHIGDDKVSLTSGKRFPVLPKNSRFTAYSTGLFIVVHTDIGISLYWDKMTRVYIKADPKWKSKLQGLCGNFDDDENNDFHRPDDDLHIINVSEFAEAWKIHDYCPSTEKTPNMCEVHPERKTWADLQCGLLKSDLFASCHYEVAVDPYFDSCIRDSCACDMGGDCECLCSAVGVYAHMCAMKGIIVKWRSERVCPFQCPRTCDKYSPCMSSCPAVTCDNINDPKVQNCNSDVCVEGCTPDPCEPGHVYSNSTLKECVKTSECIKYCYLDNGDKYKDGERIVDSSINKCQTCYCRKGEIKCSGEACTTLPKPTTVEVTTEPTTTVKKYTECESGWTKYFNDDSPATGHGDSEIIFNIKEKYNVCHGGHIVDIKCRAVSVNGSEPVPWQMTGDKELECNHLVGLDCRTKAQDHDHLCQDYEISLKCSCDGVTETTTTPVYISTTTSKCPDGEIWSECAYGCRQTCLSFYQQLAIEGYCSADIDCVPGCRPFEPCDPPKLWREDKRCVDPANCTCRTIDDTVIPPGGIVTKDCEQCSCFENLLQCHTIPSCNRTVTGSPLLSETHTTPTVTTATSTMKVMTTRYINTSECWTEWVNIDNPSSDDSDLERITEIRWQYTFCKDPVAIECRVASTKQKASDSGQLIKCSLEQGLLCYNKDNLDHGGCYDYELRFYCPCELSTTPIPTTVSTPSPCIQGWTDWFNSNIGDEWMEYESIQSVRDSGEKFCATDKISDMECKPSDNSSIDVTLNAKCDISHGLRCSAAGIHSCADYSVRFYCQCRPKRSTSTTVTVGLTTIPTTAPPTCNYWSRWINDDKPNTLPGDIETETGFSLQKNENFCSEGYVTQIECFSVDSKKDYRKTGESLLNCSVTNGFSCINSNQYDTDWSCEDYQIRYYCSCVKPTTAQEIFTTQIVILPTVSTVLPECTSGSLFKFLSESNLVSDSNIKSSSSSANHGANMARVDSGSGWIPAPDDDKPHLEVDLGQSWPIYGIVTYGGKATNSWVTSYQIWYSSDGIAYRKYLDQSGHIKIFTGNYDTESRSVHVFIPFEARYVRIIPITAEKRFSLRFDLFGCSQVTTTVATTTSKRPGLCDESLGLEDYRISEGQISVSSMKYVDFGVNPVRLNSDVISGPGAWIAGAVDYNQYIQIDFLIPSVVEAILTQGRDKKEEWVTSYTVSYSSDAKKWDYIYDDGGTVISFGGNYDSSSIVTNVLERPVRARFLRIHPTKWHKWISMRLEVKGCFHNFSEGCLQPIGSNDGLIRDEWITTSSIKSHCNIGDSRLNSESGCGGWVAKLSVPGTHIQFDLQKLANVTGIITQGRENTKEWVTSFKVMHSEDEHTWTTLINDVTNSAVFTANFDSQTSVTNTFSPSFTARYVRIIPVRWHKWIAMRLELLGCYIQILSTTTTTPAVTTPEPCIQWSDWISTSIPTPKNEGDIEPISEIIKNTGLCLSPVKIECREPLTGLDYTAAGQKVSCDLTSGLRCLHDDQPQKSCYNYEVRIGCWSCGTTTIQPPVMCPNINESSKCPARCDNPNQVCNGWKCVDPSECPCVIDGQIVKLGDSVVDKDCQECVCLLNGATKCTKTPCPSCSRNERKIFDEHTCKCTCEECPTGQRLCPTNGQCINETKWCDGIVDCPDDEVKCPVTTMTPPITTPIPPAIVSCYVYNKIVKTFDGQEFESIICNHVLISRKSKRSFKVAVETECSSGIYSEHKDGRPKCKKFLLVKINDVKIEVDGNLRVTYNGYKYTPSQLAVITKANKDLDVVVVGNMVIVRSLKYKFDVYWDTQSNVHLMAHDDLLGDVNGICGFYNNNPADDKQKSDGGQALNVVDYVDSWANKGPKLTCPDHVCPANIMDAALKTCHRLFEPPFEECNAVMSEAKSQYSLVCMNEICECTLGGSTIDQCKCDAYLLYVTECMARLNKTSIDWRIKHGCAPKCPAGFEWHDCGSPCEATCDNYQKMECHDDGNKCIPGCYCPPGLLHNENGQCVEPKHCYDRKCTGSGDPNYVTFDGKSYSFNGNCSYVLMKSLVNGVQLDVEGVNSPCNPEKPFNELQATCLTGLNINYKGDVVKIRKSKPLEFDNRKLENEDLPIDKDGIRLRLMSEQSVLYEIRDIGVEIRYFKLNHGFRIKIPSSIFKGNVVGLCGNSNFDELDDFRLRDGSDTTDTKEFVVDWLTQQYSEDQCLTTSSQNEKITLPPNVCDEFWDVSFGSCHPLVNPTSYIEQCRAEIHFYNKDVHESLCTNLMEYSRECCSLGLRMNHWVEKYNCSIPCSGGMKYEVCGPACVKNCENYKREVECDISKVDGCYCPGDKVLKDGKCVDPQKCEICDKNGHYVGDTWSDRPCSTCNCGIGKMIECVVQECPEKPICAVGEKLAIMQENDTNSCCTKYNCIQNLIKCPDERPSACLPGEVSKVVTDDKGCPKYICECDEGTCPSMQWPANLAIGQTTIIESDGCCNIVKIVCNKDRCPAVPKCPERFTMETTAGVCCDSYFCEPPPDKCTYTTEFSVVDGKEIKLKIKGHVDVEYKPGVKWRDGLCKNCECITDLNGLHSANCLIDRCATLDDIEDTDEYVYQMEGVPNRCCSEIKRAKCIDDRGQAVKVGTSWFASNDSCTMYKCVMGSKKGIRKVERKIECDDKCPQHMRYEKPSADSKECCGRCVPFACIEHGKVYRVGQNWTSESKKCYVRECVDDGSNVDIRYTHLDCPPIYANCPKENIIDDAAGCCKTCNITPGDCLPRSLTVNETIGLVKVKHDKYGQCRNAEPIHGYSECFGECFSQSIYSAAANKFHNLCHCCTPKGTKKVDVKLVCETGSLIDWTVYQPTSCSCSRCDRKHDANIRTKTQHMIEREYEQTTRKNELLNEIDHIDLE